MPDLGKALKIVSESLNRKHANRRVCIPHWRHAYAIPETQSNLGAACSSVSMTSAPLSHDFSDCAYKFALCFIPVGGTSDLWGAEDGYGWVGLPDGLAKAQMVLVCCHANDKSQWGLWKNLPQGICQSLGGGRCMSSITHKPMSMWRVPGFQPSHLHHKV